MRAGIQDIWESTPGHIKSNKSWCPICAGNVRKSIKDMQLFAKKMGGKCLSKKYTNTSTKLTWECENGHKWESKPSHIIAGHWCPYCAGLHKTAQDMKKLAEKREGRCLSNEYIDDKTKLLWECKYGHKWEATPTNIKDKGAWCPYCAGNGKKTIEELNKTAAEHDAKCLSDKYINTHTKYQWKCFKGHVWEASLNTNLKRSDFCPICAKEMRKHKYR